MDYEVRPGDLRKCKGRDAEAEAADISASTARHRYRPFENATPRWSGVDVIDITLTREQHLRKICLHFASFKTQRVGIFCAITRRNAGV